MSQLVEDWLVEFEKFNQYENSPDEVHAYAIGIFNYPDLIGAIINILEDEKSYSKLLAPICTQLHSYHRMKDDRLRLFVIAFLPSLIGIHLQYSVKPMEVKRKYRCVDTVLLGIYNAEIGNEECLGSSRTFRVASISKPSIFHEPPTNNAPPNQPQQQPAPIAAPPAPNPNNNENYGFRADSAGIPTIQVPVYNSYKTSDYLNASNRASVLTALLHLFHDHMSSLPKQSLIALCRMTISVLEKETRPPADWKSLLNQHPGAIGNLHNTALIPDFPRKIPVASDTLVRLSSCVYFCIYNGLGDISIQAMDHIHRRALCELLPDVLLMTNAIKHQLDTNPPQPPTNDEVPMGMNLSQPTDSNLAPVASSSSSSPSPSAPAAGSSSSNKAAITNASFKTRKLPEDIPIVTGNTNPKRLPSINEDNH